ncbi:MAG: hypothetical protein HZA48_02435 [Planctomycetes bacterium]|nr:hypothetical protein [Planctomycetota bacterium]
MFDNWGMVEMVYAICFFMGFVYAILTALLSGIFSGCHDVDAGGADAGGMDAGGADAGGAAGGMDGHVSVDGQAISTGEMPDHGLIQFSPFSPIVVAMFISSFGASGIICKQIFNLPLYWHLPISLATGFAIAGGTFLMFSKLFRATQSSSEAQSSDLIELEAEVITPVPDKGVGEIAYYVKGSRYTAPAKSFTGNPINNHVHVIIKKVVGTTFFVIPKV